MGVRVVADQISVKRGEDHIFEKVSFEVGAGQALVVTGPNGVGKSTLLRALAGLLPFETGSFTIETDISDEFQQREYCHYLGHQNAMKPELTVLDNLKFWQETMGVADKFGAADTQIVMSPYEASEALGLAHTLDLPFGFLSQGQRRRISLAKLFISYRPVWLIDEPTAALDMASTKKFAELSNDYLKQGGIIIAATHEPLNFINSVALELSPAIPSQDEF